MIMAPRSSHHALVIPGAPRAREGDPGVRASLLGPLPLRGFAAPAGDDSEHGSGVAGFISMTAGLDTTR